MPDKNMFLYLIIFRFLPIPRAPSSMMTAADRRPAGQPATPRCADFPFWEFRSKTIASSARSTTVDPCAQARILAKALGTEETNEKTPKICRKISKNLAKIRRKLLESAHFGDFG